jgi:hypothetical protein
METRKIKPDNLPFSFPVPVMAKILGINNTAGYEIVRRSDFKAAVRIGKRIVIIRDLFLDWLERQAAVNE